MEPHREEQPNAPPPGAEPKPKRFRVVKLEERIAPSGSKYTKGHCYTGKDTGYLYTWTCNCTR